jgi:hypothetical protein
MVALELGVEPVVPLPMMTALFGVESGEIFKIVATLESLAAGVGACLGVDARWPVGKAANTAWSRAAKSRHGVLSMVVTDKRI